MESISQIGIDHLKIGSTKIAFNNNYYASLKSTCILNYF